jgi:hypothetical protein
MTAYGVYALVLRIPPDELRLPTAERIGDASDSFPGERVINRARVQAQRSRPVGKYFLKDIEGLIEQLTSAVQADQKRK